MGSQMTAWQVQKQVSRLLDVFMQKGLSSGKCSFAHSDCIGSSAKVKVYVTEDCHQQKGIHCMLSQWSVY